MGLLIRGIKREDVSRGQVVCKAGSLKTYKVGGQPQASCRTHHGIGPPPASKQCDPGPQSLWQQPHVGMECQAVTAFRPQCQRTVKHWCTGGSLARMSPRPTTHNP